ncbi:protein FAM180A-like [Synchiropus splendidus]|uniref:protein FAM180A-like n=1 Tax=Synchiropus splendidus TaxID=270530 RepID=UPI00237D80AC|nr:protein FAM180A-like [Synchiropus splendidus]
MLPWTTFVVALFICAIHTDAGRNKALFPPKSRIRRGTASSFIHSFEDVHLLFEILLTGVHFDAEELSVSDAELASMRKTQKLEVICVDFIPRKATEIFRLLANLTQRRGRLQQEDFERTLLTLVYTAQMMAGSTATHQRGVWAHTFVGLYRTIKQDLTDSK